MSTIETITNTAISVGATILVEANPELAVFTTAFQTIGEGVISSILGEALANRVDTTFHETLIKIKDNLAKGKIPRDDDVWSSEKESPRKAKAILEGVLVKARDEFEEKKRRYYPNFSGNMCFYEHIPYERLNILLRTLDQLSYRQLQVLAYVKSKGEIITNMWDARIKNIEQAYKYYDVFCEVLDLSNKSLLRQIMQGLTPGIGNKLCLSPMGEDLVNLLELENMPNEDINHIAEQIDAINAIIQRNEQKRL